MESIYPGSTSSSVLLSNKETQLTQMKETVFFSMYFSANIQYILHTSGKSIRTMVLFSIYKYVMSFSSLCLFRKPTLLHSQPPPIESTSFSKHSMPLCLQASDSPGAAERRPAALMHSC